MNIKYIILQNILLIIHSLLVRIKADDPHAVCQLGAKFGCSVYEACRMLHIAYMLGLKVVGVRYVVRYNSMCM